MKRARGKEDMKKRERKGDNQIVREVKKLITKVELGPKRKRIEKKKKKESVK
jgi:hypothetical protein